jgi:hypothetical protein
MNRVVPFAMKVVALEIDMGKLFVRDLSPNGILAVIQAATRLRARDGEGVSCDFWRKLFESP